MSEGVSFVLPVRNGERWLEQSLSAILAQADGRPFEVVVVDDGSHDGSGAILRRHAADRRIRLLQGERRGAAAAINLGIRHAVHPIICQVDQDVIVEPGWMTTLCGALSDPRAAAAQGCYQIAPDASLWARVMSLDLEQRYSRVHDRQVDHACTGNTAYRAESLRAVGLFDEALGYGYDNDMSYRLVQAGCRLTLCRHARSVHHWRDSWHTYFAQQYGFGFGRLDLVAKHRRRAMGDDVSRMGMMLHAPIMLTALGAGSAATVLWFIGWPWKLVAIVGSGLVLLLTVERFGSGALAAVRFRNSAGWFFAPVHLWRDVAWALALVRWCVKRCLQRPVRPSDSMYPRGSTRERLTP